MSLKMCHEYVRKFLWRHSSLDTEKTQAPAAANPGVCSQGSFLGAISTAKMQRDQKKLGEVDSNASNLQTLKKGKNTVSQDF